MADEVLPGAEVLIRELMSRLEQQVPLELGLIETARGRPAPAPTDPGETDLWRPPGLYATSDRAILEPDDYPAVLGIVQHTLPARVVDIVDGRDVYVVPYVVRVWAFVRHWGYPEVEACRSRLGAGVLQALLRRRQITPAIELLPGGWRTSYSEVGVSADDERSYGGWWVEFTAEQVEILGDVMRAPSGPVLDIDLRVHPEADPVP